MSLPKITPIRIVIAIGAGLAAKYFISDTSTIVTSVTKFLPTLKIPFIP